MFVRLLIAGSLALVFAAGCSKKEAAAPTAGAAAGVGSSSSQFKPLPVPPPAKYVRDHYKSLEDCAFDWGHAGRCMPVPAGAPERNAGAAFFGPNYSNAIRDESQLEARKLALQQGYVTSLDEQPSNRAVGTSDTPKG
ncbi:MAG: hypothetical protein U5L03_04285 [Burkholderiaceae bacterium]|nr:hypothetical protein [Burkholderiaceae bacterium]